MMGTALPAVFILQGLLFGGPAPYSLNETVEFSPASNTKIFTAAAALQYLGSDYRFETTLSWKRNRIDPSIISDLILTGSGDPSWGMSEFGEGVRTRLDQYAQSLARLGVTEIRGPISLRANDPRWDNLVYPAGWLPIDHDSCYGAQAHAFNLNINCASLIIRMSEQGMATSSWIEEGMDVPVRVEIKLGEKTDLSISFDSRGPIVTGTVASKFAVETLYLPVMDIDAWVLRLFKIALMGQGIVLNSAAAQDLDSAVQQLSFYSPKLSEILVPFMKLSLNQIGDALFKKIGSLTNASDTDLLSAGASAMREYAGGFGSSVFYDGSGVSKSNRVTPKTVMSILNHLTTQTYFSSFWDSLPIAGVDGTLKKRMKGTAAENLLRAKTGTLDGVYNLSGYVPRYVDGVITEYVPFVMLSSTTPENKTLVLEMQDAAGAKLAEFVGP